MKYRLVNSAVMPRPGLYEYRPLSPEQFGDAVARASQTGCLCSYIGYEQTAALVEKLSGVKVPLCRDQTPIEEGDALLIVKLRYRVANPATKGEQQVNDFEFGIAHYWATGRIDTRGVSRLPSDVGREN